jgi:hypothetical protein
VTCFKIEGTITENIALLTITQEYKNNSEDPIEAVFAFPNDPNVPISRLELELEGKVIQGKIMKKEEAE